MTTTISCLGAMALAIGVALAGVELAHAQLGTGDDVVGRGAEVLGGSDTARDEAASPASPQAVGRATVGDCVTNRTRFRILDNAVSTTSSSFVLMPNTHVPVTTSGGCLIVDFAGEVRSFGATVRMYIRAAIAGIGPAEPPAVALGDPATVGVYETRSMRFVFPNVPAGTHTVRIEFRSEINGTQVGALARTLTVQYRK